MNEYDACEQAYKNGYKKAAEEIFTEIEKVSCRISESDKNGYIRVLCYQLSAEKLAKLKKKYTEEKA